MTITLNDLTFPAGEFSHTELASFNGLDRKKVWTAYQKAINDGIIIPTGNERKSGKGKAAVLWKVKDGQTTVKVSDKPVVVVVAPQPVVVPQPIVADKPKKAKVEPKPEVVVNDILPPVVPTVPPPEVVEVVKVVAPKAEVKIEDLKPVVAPAGVNLESVKISDEKCPLCHTQLVQAIQNSGIRVWCPQQARPSICSSNESPFGFGKSVKEAYDKLCQKYCRPVNEA